MIHYLKRKHSKIVSQKKLQLGRRLRIGKKFGMPRWNFSSLLGDHAQNIFSVPLFYLGRLGAFVPRPTSSMARSMTHLARCSQSNCHSKASPHL